MFQGNSGPEPERPKCARCGQPAAMNEVFDALHVVEVWGQPSCYPCFEAWERACPDFGAQLPVPSTQEAFAAVTQQYRQWTAEFYSKGRPQLRVVPTEART